MGGTSGGSRRGRLLSILGIVLSLGLLAFTVLWARCGLRGCPDVDELRGYIPEEASVILDREGEEIGKLFQVNRTIVQLDSLPEFVPDAFVAAEDRRFWDHGGIDWRRIPGAALANVKAGGVAEGFSTITMQLARNLFPDKLPAAQQTIWRKLGEMRVARSIERRYEKEEILQMYLNQVYFGSGAWGIEAAANEYFGTSAASLSLAQAALLAAVLPAPSRLNPRSNMEAAVERQQLVLDRMVAEGFIDQARADEAAEEEIDLARSTGGSDANAPYFVEAVRQELEDVFGTQLYTEGFRIHTTLDVDVQERAERELVRQLNAIEAGRYGSFRGDPYDGDADADGTILQGAVVVMNAETGGVLALVGGRDFELSKYNRALQAERQPGSAFKPFVYATAIARGYPPTTRIEDTPLRRTLSGGRVWEPRNYGDSYAGQVTMREALYQSRNVSTVRLAEQVGLEGILRTARVMGISGDLPEVPSVVLGAGEVTLIDMVSAYAAFATLGQRPEPFFVARIEDRNGRVVWSQEPRLHRVIEPSVAFVVTDILRDVVDRGTATAVRGAGFRAPAAGKTGTTNEAADAWFIGFTPSTVAGVWIGFDEPQTIVPRASGGTLAAPVWARVMIGVQDRGGSWTPPPGVEQRQVDELGNVVASNCPTFGGVREEWFLTGTAPMGDCRYPGGMGWDSMYAGWDSMPPLDEEQDGWLERMRRRLFGDDEQDRAGDRDERPRIRPGRPEDTIPLYRQPAPRPDTPARPAPDIQPDDDEPAPTPQPQPEQPEQPEPAPQPAEPDEEPLGERVGGATGG